MSIEQITTLFGWMTVINIGLMILSIVIILPLKDVMCRVHGKLFGLTKEQIMMAVYCYLGAHKIAIIAFNLVPYLALKLVYS